MAPENPMGGAMLETDQKLQSRQLFLPLWSLGLLSPVEHQMKEMVCVWEPDNVKKVSVNSGITLRAARNTLRGSWELRPPRRQEVSHLSFSSHAHSQSDASLFKSVPPPSAGPLQTCILEDL